MEFISVGYESTKYLINRFILQECRNFNWRVSDCEELVGSYSQEMSGIGNAFPTVLPNADYSYYTLKTSGFKTF